MKAVVLHAGATTANIAGEGEQEVVVHAPSGARIAIVSGRVAEYVAKHFPHMELVDVEKDELMSIAEHEKGEEQRAVEAEAAAKSAQEKADAEAKELEELRAYKKQAEVAKAGKPAETAKKDEAKK